MAKGKTSVLISVRTIAEIFKMVLATLALSFVTSYWFTPVQGARQVLQVLDGATTPFVDQRDDGDDDQRKFNTFWPMVMMLITAIIFIIIIIIVCKRFCRNNGRPEWGRRNRSHELDESDVNRLPRETRAPSRDESARIDDAIWSIDMSNDDVPPSLFYMKPPPYIEKPPSYDDINDVTELPKYCTDNAAFEGDGVNNNSPSTSVRAHRVLSSQSVNSSRPNEPPPVYQPPDRSQTRTEIEQTSRSESLSDGSNATEPCQIEVF